MTKLDCKVNNRLKNEQEKSYRCTVYLVHIWIIDEIREGNCLVRHLIMYLKVPLLHYSSRILHTENFNIAVFYSRYISSV